MENLWFLLPLLACPLVMGGMMVWMMRGKRRDEASKEKGAPRDP